MSIRIGLIGAGVMGADHARILTTAVAGVELVAVADPDAMRVADILKLCQGARAHAHPLDLIHDREVDAVLIASPDETHGKFVLACLNARKPVLCEKPLAPSIAECLTVVAKEQELGRRLVTVGFMRRFDPGYVEMRRRLREGELGAALILHCIHRNRVAPGFMTAPMLISNSAVHEFDIARFILGREIKRITVITPRKTSLSTMADPQILLLEMDNGVVVDAEIFLNAQYGYDVRAELVCEKGTITLAPPHAVTVLQSALQGFAFPSDWRPRFALAYRAELQAWVEAIRSGAATGASAWDGYVATAVATAGLQALASGQPTEVKLEQRPALYDEGRAPA
ncbi:MAG: Gfo/Idh/MocA family oxidoreductase [Gammaproteobacteria bacterium]